MESINKFALEQFPSSAFSDTIERRNRFADFIRYVFPTKLQATYNFIKVRGDGSCFFHSILRYFGYLTWLDLPNKDSDLFNEEEELVYQLVLSNLRETSTEFIRTYLGIVDFVLDPNVPEYQLVCKYISDTMNLRIVIIEYDAYNSSTLNKVYQFEPIGGEFTDSAILINLSNHFTLVFPVSTDPKYDTHTIRRMVVDELITNAFITEKMA
jgi:hypothetical protein